MQINRSSPCVNSGGAVRPARISHPLLLATCAVAAVSLAACPGRSHAQDLPPGTAAPIRIVYIQPGYPQRAQMMAASGDVTLQFVLDTKGQPQGIQVVGGTAPRLFTRSALAAAKRWRYEPMVIEGKPVAMPMQVVVRFLYL